LALVLALIALPIIAALLWQLSGGPRASAWKGRVPFVVIGSSFAAAMFGALLAWGSAWSAVSAGRRWFLVALGIALASLAVAIDTFILVRLYPAFHFALTALALLCLTVPLRAVLHGPTRPSSYAWLGGVCAASAILGSWSLWAVLHSQNPRFVLSDRTASAGDVLFLASRLHGNPHLETPLRSGASAVVNDKPSTQGSLPVHPRASLFLITVDAMRADRLALAGATRKPMPNLDKLAADSVVFSRAYTPYPHTSYAISSLMTGKYTHALFDVPEAPQAHETWPEMLRLFHYRTAGFFTNAIFFIDRARFNPYAVKSYGFSYRKVDYLSTAQERVTQVLEFLDQTKREATPSPVFVWTHLFEAHEPYDPMCQRYGDEPVDRYDCELSTMDQALGPLLERLETDYPDAVLIVTADHGEEFGDHGGLYHGTTLYDEQVKVPLLMKVPGVAHRLVDAPVSLVDLLGTSLRLLDVPVPARVRSNDLRPWLIGRPPRQKAHAYAAMGEEVMLASDRHKLICQKSQELCRLYDSQADPKETRSVAQEHPQVVRELKERLFAMQLSHAQVELRPIETDDGLVGWPESIGRAMAGDRSAIAPLQGLIADPSTPLPQRRKAAQLVRGLWKTQPLERLPELTSDQDPVVACWLWLCALEHGDESALEPVALACTQLDRTDEARRAAAPALLRSGHRQGFEEVAFVAMDKSAPPEQRAASLESLADRRYRRLAPRVEALLDEYQLTLAAAKTLGAFRLRSSVPSLIARFERERFADRKAAIAAALAEMGDSRAVQALTSSLFQTGGPPRGVLESLVRLAAPGRSGKAVSVKGQGKAMIWKSPKLGIRLRTVQPSVLRIVVRAKTMVGEGFVNVSCGEEAARVPVSAKADESFVELPTCGRADNAMFVTLSAFPEDLGVEIESIAILSLEADELAP
jgi:arylsulfatase A-like enzyme